MREKVIPKWLYKYPFSLYLYAVEGAEEKFVCNCNRQRLLSMKRRLS